MSIPVTVLVQTKNEAVGIEACLRSLEAFDEVLVVDSNSTDGTQDIVRSMGREVIDFTWNGRYPKKKQWQLDTVQTKHEWVLFLDADEQPTDEFIRLLPELIATANERGTAALDLQLVYVFDGRPLLHGHRVQKRALIRRGRAAFPVVDDLLAPGMGELEGHYQPTVTGGTQVVPDAILHDDKDPVRTWFDRHNRYSDWETYLRTAPTVRHSVADLRSAQGRLFDRIPGKPLAFFLFAYVVRAGFLDGRAGLNYATALSFYYWQIGLKVREQRRVVAERDDRTAVRA